MQDFRFLSMFNQWVNGRLYPVVEQLTEEEYKRDMGAFFGSIHGTLNHLLIIDRIQISRFTGDDTDDIKTARDILHDSFAGLRQARDAFDRHIIDSVAALDASALDQRFVFRTKAGNRDVEMIGRHILLAMFNHQTHHRGQVHCMLTQLGRSIPGLDVPLFAYPPVAPQP